MDGMLMRLFVLGKIPGTEIRISFIQIVAFAAATLLLLITYTKPLHFLHTPLKTSRQKFREKLALIELMSL